MKKLSEQKNIFWLASLLLLLGLLTVMKQQGLRILDFSVGLKGDHGQQTTSQSPRKDSPTGSDAKDGRALSRTEIPQVWASWKSIHAGSETADVYQVFQQFREILQTHPEQSSEILAILSQEKAISPDTQRRHTILYGALAQSKDPKNASELAKLALSCTDHFCQLQSLVAVSDHPLPPVDTLAPLFQVAQLQKDNDIGDTALLTLGSVGAKIPEAQIEVSSFLQRRYQELTDKNQQLTVIAAMGNHGDEGYLPQLITSANHTDGRVRAAALYSLRYLPSEQARDILIEALAHETDTRVRQEALKALEYHHLNRGEYEKITRLSLAGGDKEEQQYLVSILGKSDDEEGSLSLLERIRAETKFEGVKAAAEEVLSSSAPR